MTQSESMSSSSESAAEKRVFEMESRRANLVWTIARHAILSGKKINVVCDDQKEADILNQMIDANVREMNSMTWSI